MTLIQRLNFYLNKYIKILQLRVDRFWYCPLLGILAALDNFLVVIPNDGILISSSMLKPRRWFPFALSVAIGSTLGSVFLAALVETKGLDWILELYPGLNEKWYWVKTHNFFDQYGLILVFIVAATPFMQQPAIIMAGLAESNLTHLAAVIFFGRLIKFLIMAYIGSHAPRLLSKLWGVDPLS